MLLKAVAGQVPVSTDDHANVAFDDYGRSTLASTAGHLLYASLITACRHLFGESVSHLYQLLHMAYQLSHALSYTPAAF